MQYLLDTNVVIDYLQLKIPMAGMAFISNIIDDNAPIISVISKMETLGFNFPAEKEQLIMEIFVNNSLVLHVDDRVVNQTISIKKSKKIKLPDAVIAATALVHDCTLITRNISDFKGIDGLNLIDPYSS